MGIRTPDLLNAIEALYQLSYDPAVRSAQGSPAKRHVKVRATVNQPPNWARPGSEQTGAAQNYIETRSKLS